MHKIILAGLFYCLCVSSYCQKLILLEAHTEAPVEGALVFTESPLAYGMSNTLGEVSLTTFRGFVGLTIRALGYQTIVTTINFDQGIDQTIYLTPSLFNLDQVVVSATKWSQTIDNVPMKIIRIDPEVVRFQNPQTAADLLGTSGKVFIQKSQQGGGSPMIRGFATNRLIYTVDGVRMNTAIFRGGNIQNVINLDPFVIENTEVLFGPGSVIYGSDAIGGVMSFQTLKPKFSSTDSIQINGNLSSRYASANHEKTGHIDINLGGKKWASLTSLSYWDYDHLKQGENGPDEYLKSNFVIPSDDGNDQIQEQENPLLQRPSAYTQFNLMQKIRFQPNEHLDLQYGFHYSSTSSYGRYDRHNRLRNGLPRYAEWNYGPQTWSMNHFQAEYSHSNRLFDEMTARLAKQDFEESRINRSLNSTSRSIRIENVRAYSANLDFLKSFGFRHSLYYGLEYVINDVASLGYEENSSTGQQVKGPSRYPDADWRSLGVYLSDEIKMNENWTFNAGVRWNGFGLRAVFDTTFYPLPFTKATLSDGSLTGSLGSVYRPSDSWVINLNAGTAFRSPNVDDIGKVFDSEPGAVTVPNPNLKAEYAYNIDAGMTKLLGNHIKIDVTGYFTWLNQAMVRRDYLLNGEDSISYDGMQSNVQAIQNAANANVYGLQLGLEWKSLSGWSFQTDLNAQEGNEEMDDGTISPSRHAAPFFGVSRIQYSTDRWKIEFNGQYQGTRTTEKLAIEERSKTEIYALDENGNAFAQGWYTLNLKTQYKISEWLTANFGLENITNQRYRPYSSGISGAGRNMLISLRGSF